MFYRSGTLGKSMRRKQKEAPSVSLDNTPPTAGKRERVCENAAAGVRTRRTLTTQLAASKRHACPPNVPEPAPSNRLYRKVLELSAEAD